MNKRGNNKNTTTPIDCFAYCFADGVLRFGPNTPAGALVVERFAIAVERAKEQHRSKPLTTEEWERGLQTLCRRAYDDRTFLIPGIPECGEDQHEAVEALNKFCSIIRERTL